MTYAIVSVLSFFAGIVQSIAGFGAGIVMMLGYPYLFTPLIRASAVSATTNAFLNYSLTARYWKVIEWKKMLLPIVTYIPFATAAIFISTSLPQNFLKKCFGIFLIILAIYYLTASLRKKEVHLNIATSIIFLAISGICSALFGIGGPLIILYFMSELKEPKKYIATTQGFFALTSTYNLILRIINGIITWDLVPYIAIGAVLVTVGGIIGSKFVSKINQQKLKMITYIMVLIAGITNLF